MKNIYLTIVLMALGIGSMAQTSVWDGKRELWTRGNGTEESPYLIESAQNLAFLAYMCANGYYTNCLYFKLTTDIDLNGSEDLPWQPIGGMMFTDIETGCSSKSQTADNAFQGHFDGDGHRIYNIYVDAYNSGLFGSVYTQNASIENVKIVNGYIQGGRTAGGIAGLCNGRIRNCMNGAEIHSDMYAGGIAGSITDSISECYNEGKVVGETAGGIAGNLSGIGPRIVINCYNIADIDASMASGGIVGIKTGKPTIKNCYNVGNISCDSIYSGGIIGLQNAQADTIVNSYYLNTCGAEGLGEAKTDDEMRDRAFVDLLNNETDVWCFDQNNVNHGYPILGFNDTNVAESQTETFGIYPNPAFTTLTVENGNATEISVFNTIGQKVKQITAHAEKTDIDVSDLPNGLYLIILGGKSASVTQRFIVTH